MAGALSSRRLRVALTALGLLVALGIAAVGPALAQPAAPETTRIGRVEPDRATPLRGAASALGAIIWLHPWSAGGEPADPPPWMARLVAAGWDMWRLDRLGRADPLAEGAARVVEGSAMLRGLGYRRVMLVGDSRGAFLALGALAAPAVAEAVVMTAPAAHGRAPERRPQALADFAAGWNAARLAPGARAALVLFADDAWDPDPPARGAAFRAAAARMGVAALLIDRPAAPRGHDGVHGEEFDARLGACLAGFIDPEHLPPAECP